MSQKFLNPIEVNGQVTADYLDLSTTISHSVNAGEIAWNPVDGTFDIGLLNNVTLQAGQEMYFYGKATEIISNGDAVMFAGVQEDHLLLAKADATTINAAPEYFMGIATQDFTTNQFGYVTSFGNIRGIDTTLYTLGDILYFDSTSAIDGLLTATMPTAPNAKIIVAAVVRVHATQGILSVRPHTMPKLSDIQDVNTSLSKSTPVDGDSVFLQDSTDQNIWKKLSWSNVKSTLKTYFDTIYQQILVNPVTGTGTTNYVSKFTGTTSLGNSQIFDNGTNVGIGTITPNTNFEIKGKPTENTTLRISTNGAGSELGVIQFYRNSAASGTIFYEASGGGNQGITVRDNRSDGASNIIFSTNGANERMRINSSGNVGIGTTSPTGKLDVVGVSAGGTLLGGRFSNITANATGVKTRIELPVFNGSSGGVIEEIGNSIDGYRLNIYQSQSSGVLTFGTAGDNERMRITSAGNVGIGTSNPLYKLHIIGDVYTSTGYIAAGNSYMNSIGNTITNNNANLSLTTSGVRTSRNIADSNTVFAVSNLNASSTGAVQTWNNSTGELMRVTQNGNVGIGTTSPTTKLHIIDTSFSVSPSIKVTHDVGFINQSIEVIGSAFDGGGIVSVDTNANLIFKRGGSESMRIDGEGKVGIGTSSPNASAILHLQSTTKGFLPPVMKDSERAAISSPAQGLMIFNKDTGRINVFDGIDWKTVAWA